MSTVHLAKSAGRLIVVKVLPAEMSGQVSVERLKSENRVGGAVAADDLPYRARVRRGNATCFAGPDAAPSVSEPQPAMSPAKTSLPVLPHTRQATRVYAFT